MKNHSGISFKTTKRKPKRVHADSRGNRDSKISFKTTKRKAKTIKPFSGKSFSHARKEK